MCWTLSAQRELSNVKSRSLRDDKQSAGSLKYGLVKAMNLASKRTPIVAGGQSE
jgi:hypothetical protein